MAPFRFWLLFAATLSVLLVALLARVTGIHWDENGYGVLATSSPLGDSPTSGKPPAFYLLNYAGVRALGGVLGPYRGLALYVMYAGLCAASLAWFVGTPRLGRGRTLALWALLVVSPVFVFNGTHVMMETPVLALLTVLFGLALRGDDAVRLRWARAVEAGCVVLAVLFKESAIPALAALAGAALLHDRRLAGRLLLWIAAALAASWAVRGLLHVPPQDYGGVGSWSAWTGRAHMLRTFAKLWIFLVGPLLIAAAVLSRVPVLRGLVLAPGPVVRGGERRDAFLLSVVLGSLALTLGVALTSQGFARYAYPAIWIGVLAIGAWALGRVRTELIPALIVSVAIPTANMWAPPTRILSLWPSVVTREAIHSGGTVLFGAPVHGWLLRDAGAEPLCVLVVGSEEPKHVLKVREYLSWARPTARVFDETSTAAFDACPGRKTVLKRTHRLDPAECACPGAAPYRSRTCVLQHMAAFSDGPGDVRNVYCLP